MRNIDSGKGESYKHLMDSKAMYLFIGAAIRRRRKELGMTQEQLATLMGVSRASLANIEIGRQSILVHQLLNFVSNLSTRLDTLLPPANTSKPSHSPSDFPLPKGLSPLQREQISNLLGGASPDAAASTKKGMNVSQAKQRSKD